MHLKRMASFKFMATPKIISWDAALPPAAPSDTTDARHLAAEQPNAGYPAAEEPNAGFPVVEQPNAGQQSAEKWVAM